MALLDQLIGQRTACKSDAPHSARCKRCSRGRATASHRPTATTTKKDQ